MAAPIVSLLKAFQRAGDLCKPRGVTLVSFAVYRIPNDGHLEAI